MRTSRLVPALLSVLTLVSVAACGGGGGSSNDGTSNAALENGRIQLLQSMGPNIVFPAIQETLAACRTLETEVDDLAAAPNATTLDDAQAAWVALRASWNRTEGLLFGPIRQQSLEAFCDESLIDTAAIDATVGGVDTIDAALLNARGVDERGMMALEYLLYDPAGDVAMLALLVVDANGPRRLQYLQAAAEDLCNTMQQMHDIWDPNAGDFLTTWTTAGGGNGTFAGAREAVDLLINQMILHLTEIADKRLGRPIGRTSGGAPQPPGAETMRSTNSLTDVKDDLESLRRIWTGEWDGASAFGVDQLTAIASPAVRDAVTLALQEAIDATDAIPETMVQTSGTSPQLIETAFDEARELRVLLLTDLIGALETTLGFNPDDGD